MSFIESDQMKIGILIPCYNVEHSIREVLRAFPEDVLQKVAQVVAVDNGSTDSTRQILSEIQATGDELGKRLVVIVNAQNYGLGGSQKIAYAYFMANGFSHFFIVHGDGQGDAGMISRAFFNVLDKKPDVDFIVASRFMRGSDTAAYNRLRVMGNHVFNFLTFLCTGHWMSDSGAGIIFLRVEVLKRIPFRELTNSFQFNPQLSILLFNLKGLKIVETPLIWRDSRDGSNISSLNYCMTLLKILLQYRWSQTFGREADAVRISKEFPEGFIYQVLQRQNN
ncbi:MAG: glycosyltransferase family 2 protein [Candidatus Omnitrophica bacterium]|nr:glycosyltransferase family 2 protein [Candidatus Omnitrophota bacterium]